MIPQQQRCFPSPRRRFVRLSTESVATTLPLLMMITCSQICSTSGRMWVLRMIVWSPARPLISDAGFDDLLRIETRGRLVKDQHVGIVNNRLGEARHVAGSPSTACGSACR